MWAYKSESAFNDEELLLRTSANLSLLLILHSSVDDVEIRILILLLSYCLRLIAVSRLTISLFVNLVRFLTITDKSIHDDTKAYHLTLKQESRGGQLQTKSVHVQHHYFSARCSTNKVWNRVCGKADLALYHIVYVVDCELKNGGYSIANMIT